MSFAQGSRSGLSFVTESVFGTTPTTPSLVQLPYTSHSLNLTKERVQGNDIQPDRILRTDRHGNISVGGDITVDLRKGNYDAFLESMMFSTFDTNVLKTGVTPKFFSIEDAAEDIGQYRLFTGMAVSQGSFSIRPNQMVTATFSMVGKGMSISGTSVDPVKTGSGINQPFDSYSGAINIGDFGGSGVTSTVITGVDFTVNNNLAPTFIVGANTTPQLEYGMSTIEGTVTAYFEDADLIRRFTLETESLMTVSVNDPTGLSNYSFYFPRIKFNGADAPVDNPQSRIVTMPFVALYDTATNTNLRITRTV